MPNKVDPPKRITVGPFTYKVTHDTATMNAVCRTDGADLSGRTDHAALVIDIDPKQADGQKRDTLLHELLHCLLDMTGIANAWPVDTVEDTIRRVSPILLDTLRSNPKLVTYLTAE